MTLINPFLWWQWALLCGIPLGILALYFLKLKRRPVEVPSTYLWTRAIEDLHVNSIWQRLRRSLLLFLQLLAAALLAAALFEPGAEGRQLSGERFIFLIDNSASMAATDVNGRSRLDEAKRRAELLIDEMSGNQVAMVISFSNDANVAQGFTDNKRRLMASLKEIRATNRPTDPREALRYAAGIANPGRTSRSEDVAKEVGGDIQAAEPRPATLYLLSDGGFERVQDFSLGHLYPIYIPVAGDAPRNVGVVAFDSAQNPERPDQTQAFAQLVNGGVIDISTRVALYFNDLPVIDAQEIDLPAGANRGVTFDLPPELEAGVLRLEVEAEDDFPADNVAYAAVNPPRRARVLFVSPGNEAWEDHALRTEVVQRLAEVAIARPAHLTSPEYQQKADAGAFDLIVYDQCAPERMPEANTLFFASLPPGGAWQGKPMEKPPLVVDSNLIHPLTQLVDLTGLVVAESMDVKPPQGGLPLIEADQGVLFAVAPRRRYEDAVLGFSNYGYRDGVAAELLSNFHVRPGFPVFVMNCIKYLGGSRGALGLKSVRPGEPIKLRSDSPVELLEVDPPSGPAVRVGRGSLGAFQFTGTEQQGVYEVRETPGGPASQRFSVNLFTPRESRIQVASFDVGNESLQGGGVSFDAGRREYWRWILVAVLGVLMFEWYVYNRRIFI